jgi:DNA recombination protein RmuC
MEFAVYLLVGLVLGAFAAWLFNRETRRQLAELNRSREATLAELREESSRRASFEALAAGIPDLQKEIEARSLTIAQQGRTILEVTNERQALAATLDAERRGFEEKLKLLEEAKAALSDAFNALSANALRSNSEEFLKLAQVSVAPIKEALGKFDSKIQALEVAREGAYQGLLQQVSQLLDTGRQLRSETSSSVANGARSSCGGWSRWPGC